MSVIRGDLKKYRAAIRSKEVAQKKALIGLVFQRPAIWNRNTEEHKSRSVVEATWDEIAANTGWESGCIFSCTVLSRRQFFRLHEVPKYANRISYNTRLCVGAPPYANMPLLSLQRVPSHLPCLAEAFGCHCRQPHRIKPKLRNARIIFRLFWGKSAKSVNFACRSWAYIFAVQKNRICLYSRPIDRPTGLIAWVGFGDIKIGKANNLKNGVFTAIEIVHFGRENCSCFVKQKKTNTC